MRGLNEKINQELERIVAEIENDYEDLCEVCNDIVVRGNIHENKYLLEDK